MEPTKCKIKTCLNNEKVGRSYQCSITIPTMIKLLNPNSKDCYYFSDSIEEDLKWLRQNGGMMNIILKSKGKKTEQELKDLKGRKPRSDKGKKRGPKKRKAGE